MTLYAGLDVGDKATHLCVVDGDGAILWRGACATDPEALTFTLKKHAPGLVSAVLETGALPVFLHHGLTLRGLPATCICARHAKGVLSVRGNKSDAHDALGLAHLARTGWLEQVPIKDGATHLDRTRLEVREQLIRAHRAMANQLRGRLKLFCLCLGKVTHAAKRAERLAALFAPAAGVAPGPGTARGRPSGAGRADQGLVARPRGAGPGRPHCGPPDERARRRPRHRTHLQELHRGPGPLRALGRRRRLCRPRSQAIPIRRA
jgi:transposase